MTDKEIIIDGVNVTGCNYVILPKDSCPAKSQPYAKETSCIACKEHNTRLNFCKNNPNCYYKQLQRKEQECEKLKEDIAMAGISGIIELCHENKRYKQALDKIEENNKELRSILLDFNNSYQISEFYLTNFDTKTKEIRDIINEVKNDK